MKKKDLSKDPVILKLFEKITQSREILEQDASDLSKLKVGLAKLFPDNCDFRSKFALEDKIKTMSGFVTASLSIRQEINKLLIQEIELRKKLDTEDLATKDSDIRDLIDAIESKYNIQQRESLQQDEEQIVDVNQPGPNF